MAQFLADRVLRVWFKTILIFILTLLYLIIFGSFIAYTSLPPILSFLFVSIWYILMLILVEYYIQTGRLNKNNNSDLIVENDDDNIVEYTELYEILGKSDKIKTLDKENKTGIDNNITDNLNENDEENQIEIDDDITDDLNDNENTN
jgi:hypothetical protein